MTVPKLSHLVVIPCPNGTVNTTTARLSVVLVPRLRQNGDLTEYPDFADWGNQITSLKFRLYDGTVPLGAGAPALNVTSPTVDPAVWRAVFGQTPQQVSKVKVRAAEFIDRTDTDLTSMNAAGALSGIATIVRALAKLGASKPTKTSLLAAGVDVAELAGDYEKFASEISNGDVPDAVIPEFHEILRQVGGHPYLMRLLGLVFDLEFTLPATPLTEVQVRTNWPSLGNLPGDFEDRRQIPLRMAVDSKFEPLVAAPAYRSGRWLSLGTSKYAVANGNIVDAGQSLSALNRRLASAGNADPVDVPAFDESGLSVAHTEVVTMLEDVFDRQRQLENDVDNWLLNSPPGVPPPLVRAEDATAGTRWDVMDVAKGAFRSLHQRQTVDGYDFPRDPGLAINVPTDEGWAVLAMSTDGTRALADRPTAVQYGENNVKKVERTDQTKWRVDASIMRWSGWSLSAPKPGQILNAEGNPVPRPTRAARNDDPAQVAAEYEVLPGTLTRLRFNRRYRFRARCVDLAGNSLPLSDAAPPDAVSPAVLFGRTAPVPAPTVVRRSSRPDPGVGDLPDVIVIKSELTQSNARTPGSDRMFFVPRINQLRLERHGLPKADGIDAADYAFLADRDARTLPGQLFTDPETGELVAGTAVLDGAVTAGRYRQRALYLADPAARKIVFHGLPRAVRRLPVGVDVGTWPNPESVVLELRAGSNAPSVSAATKRVTVQLPKGSTATCEVSCGIDPALLNHFAAWQSLSATERRRLSGVFLNGQNGMVSPRRTILLVHAVRVPLLSPSMSAFAGTRSSEGQTTVNIDGLVGIHRPTSERIVVRARWQGPDFDTPTILKQQSDVVLDRFLSTGGAARSETLNDVLLELGNTRRIEVTVDAEAFCRFSTYFSERRDWTATQDTEFVADVRGMSASGVVVSDATTGQVYAEGTDYVLDRVAGSVTPLVTGAIVNGTRARIQYIPLPVSRPSSQSRRGRTATFVVPSSAQPPVPKVSHALPAFSRRITATPTKITVAHDGRVVRVLLDRPWNESGAGELLGVATDLPTVPATSLALTRWGRDPLTLGTGATVRPQPSSFRKAVETVTNIDGKFGVAGHRPTLDTTRNLWTADVQVSAAFGYRPFVQLHLCRYQPDSLPGLHVSDTVSTETLRLGAARVVTFSKKVGRKVEVRLVGPDRVNTVTVRLQEADPAITDLDLRWIDVSAPLVLARSGTTSLATHLGTIDTPASTRVRRLLVEDYEPVSREVGGVLTTSSEVAYREAIDLPVAW